jgi:hypothetical protein
MGGKGGTVKRAVCIFLALAAAVLGARVTKIRCYAQEDVTFVVFYLDAECAVEVSDSLTAGEASLGLVVRGAILDSGGRLGGPVGHVAAGNFYQSGADAVFLVYPAVTAGAYRAYLARDPLRAVLEISARTEPVETPVTVETAEVEGPPDLSGLDVGPVLLVDDDDGVNNGNPYGVDVHERYTRALDALGLSYEVRVVSHNTSGPSFTELEPYRLVVYFTGLDALKVCLSESDRRALRRYLDDGGRLLLVSQNYLGQVSRSGTASPGSLEEALGVGDWRADAKTLVAIAEPEGELNAGLSLVLFGDRQIVGNWSDGFTASPGAEVLFTNRTRGDVCGVAVESGNHRSVFLSFAWENVSSEAEALALLGRCIRWLIEG